MAARIVLCLYVLAVLAFGGKAAAAVPRLPTFWEFRSPTNNDPITGISTCEEAIQQALVLANIRCSTNFGGIASPMPWTAYDATGNNYTCPQPNMNSYNWDFRCTNDFPTTPNKGVVLSAYCQSQQAAPFYTPLDDFTCPQASPNPGKSIGCVDCQVVNPMQPGFGNKFQSEVDYVGQGSFPLRFIRTYNSRANDENDARLGTDWVHSYAMHISANGPHDGGVVTPHQLAATRPDGKILPFVLSGGVWVSDPDVVERVEQTATGWKLTTRDDTVELYDLKGRILSITNRAGLTQTVNYPASGLLASYPSGVTDAFGRTLTFTYDANGRLVGFKDPAGKSVTYTVSADQWFNLTSRTDQLGGVKQYLYQNFYVGNLNSLTGLIDELGTNQYATYGYYDGNPGTRGIVWYSQHFGRAGKAALTYPDANTRSVVTYQDVTNDGGTRLYTFSTIQGVPRLTSITGDPCPECGPAATTYDSNGNVASTTDWNGNRTNFTYDTTRNLELTRTEGLTAGGATTALTRKTTTEWHPTWRLPQRIAQPLRLTTLVYNGSGVTCSVGADAGLPLPGVACSVTQQETTDTSGNAGFGATVTGTPRVWSFTYDSHGQTLTADGPRTDVTDSTAYTYYADNATCPGSAPLGCRGQLQAMANALGQVTQYLEYDAHGNPTKVVDPNGATFTMTYDALQRLTSRSANGAVTAYGYDAASNLLSVTLPDGSFLHFAYDGAHRLTDITDNLNNRVHFTLDLFGNRIQEDVFDASMLKVQTVQRVVSLANRVVKVLGGQGQATTFTYDAQGNLTSITDPLSRKTTRAFDGLNRLVKSVDAADGGTLLTYDLRDRVTSVVDPRMVATAYAYDGFGDVTGTVSADWGATTSTYDSAGNIVSYTDGKGQVTALAYDALNRPTLITYADMSQVAYAYDDMAVNGVGRLTSMTDSSGTRSYRYDPLGRLLRDTQVISAGGSMVQLALGYAYDPAGRLTAMTYPSGRVVNYSYDALGRVAKVDVADGGVPAVTVADQVAYRPFGPMTSFVTQGGATQARTFDLDGRMASYTAAGKTWNITYDAASQVTSIADAMNAMDARTYGYDALGRVVSAVTPAGLEAFTYDANGNRLMGLMTTLTYGGTDNRLMSVSGATTRSYTYDANGSPTTDGTRQFTFDAHGRMVKAINGPLSADYVVNSSGQRVGKAVTR